MTRRSFLAVLVGAVAAKPAPAEPEVVSDWPHPAFSEHLYRLPFPPPTPGGKWTLTRAGRGEIIRRHQRPYRPVVLRNDRRLLKQVIADWEPWFDEAGCFLDALRSRSP